MFWLWLDYMNLWSSFPNKKGDSFGFRKESRVETEEQSFFMYWQKNRACSPHLEWMLLNAFFPEEAFLPSRMEELHWRGRLHSFAAWKRLQNVCCPFGLRGSVVNPWGMAGWEPGETESRGRAILGYPKSPQQTLSWFSWGPFALHGGRSWEITLYVLVKRMVNGGAVEGICKSSSLEMEQVMLKDGTVEVKYTAIWFCYVK